MGNSNNNIQIKSGSDPYSVWRSQLTREERKVSSAESVDASVDVRSSDKQEDSEGVMFESGLEAKCHGDHNVR